MEPRDRAAQAVSEDRVRRRFRLLVGCLALVATAFVQAPGRVVNDTKLDLSVDPGGFLGRALSMWEPDGFFGQVQNQAYGYLFPMGPFFWLGDLADVPDWVVQRAWWALLLCVAFVGFVRLAEELRIGTPVVRLVGGVLFALSPRILTLLGTSSIEAWPSAVAPWVLVPLAVGLRRGQPRRQAALAALAVAVVGGVNAAATFAVIPLGALFLLLAPAGPRRRTLIRWWPGFVLLGTLWWLGPLFLLGRYSPPFLDFIETAENTTVAATPFDALRGTTHWTPLVSGDLTSGRVLLENPVVVLMTGLVVLAGVIGLCHPRLPYRRFLVAGIGTGLLLVTLGHAGAATGWGTPLFQDLLDGVLAPIRNTHKFDVLVHLPLLLAAAHATGVAVRSSRTQPAVVRASLVTAVVSVVAGAAVPAWTAQLPAARSFEDVPAYWRTAADWLDEAEPEGTTLLVPASAFADYVWGSSGDEPLQPLARSAWAVRNSVPLTPPQTIRLLDALSDELAQARSSEGLAASLQRAGVKRVLVRNDLRPDVTDGRTELLYQTLETSPGLTQVATFGPTLGGRGSIDLGDVRTFVQGGWQTARPAIDVFEVQSGRSYRQRAASSVPTLVGAGADTLVQLDALGVTPGDDAILAQDLPGDAPAGTVVVTDGLRRQEVGFGSVDRQRSATLTETSPYVAQRRAHDYVSAADTTWQAVARLDGARDLEASSSQAQVSAVRGVDPSAGPWSAFDGDARSAWVAQGDDGWIRLELDSTRNLGAVTFGAGLARGTTQRLLVRTEDGVVERDLVGSTPETVDVGTVDELWARVTRSDGGDARLAQVTAPTLELSRPLVLARPPSGWRPADSIVLGLDSGARPGCLEVEGDVRCRSGVGVKGEDTYWVDRVVPMRERASYTPSLRAVPLAGEALDAVLQEDLAADVRASSSVTDDPRASATMAVDGDSSTGWIADARDADPTLTVVWPSARTVDAIRLRTDPGLPASRPTAVSVVLDDGTRLRRGVPADGVVDLGGVRTSRLTISLGTTGGAFDYDGPAVTGLPVGVSELSVEGAPLGTADLGDVPVELPCGSGPDVVVDGERHETSVSTTRAALVAVEPVEARFCGRTEITLDAGDRRITAEASPWFSAGRLVLERTDAAAAVADDGTRYVLEEHNANPGWQGTSEGEPVEAITLNGWQQGWVVPAGASSDVRTTFGPATTYRVFLGIGAATFLGLVLACLVMRRRDDRPADPPARGPLSGGVSVVTALGAVVVLGLVGGTWFAASAAVGAVAAWALRRRGVAPGWPAALAVLVPVAAYAAFPRGSTASWVATWTWPQLAGAFSLGCVICAVLAPGLERRWARRSMGRSTTR